MPPPQLNGVHGSHRQAGAVDHATNVAVQGNVVQFELSHALRASSWLGSCISGLSDDTSRSNRLHTWHQAVQGALVSDTKGFTSNSAKSFSDSLDKPEDLNELLCCAGVKPSLESHFRA